MYSYIHIYIIQMSTDFERILLKDDRIGCITKEIQYGVLKGGQNVTSQVFNAISSSPSPALALPASPAGSRVISMAGNFTVYVDGAPFTVSFAEGSSINPQGTPQPAAPVSSAPVAVAPPAQTGTPVTAVMPGNVYTIEVEVGQEVKEGQDVAIIEAMKMENPVKAPCSGKILSIISVKGGTVGMGDVMMYIG